MANKTLSLLLVLAMCLTVGGVYAAWTYAGSDDIVDGYKEITIEIEDVIAEGAHGTYKIETNLSFKIDQNTDAHDAMLVSYPAEGAYLKVTFTPNAIASDDIKANGVATELYFTTTTPMQVPVVGNHYEPSAPEGSEMVDIFAFTNPSDGEFNANIEWTRQDDGSFVYILEGEEATNWISLTRAFVLDTKTDHDAFRDALNGNIVIKVTDGTLNNAGNNG